MITATNTGLVACYEGGQPRPIVGWREGDGAPLIVERQTGRLVPAAEYAPPDGSKFWAVIVAESPIIAAVPGQGWSVQHREADGTTRETSVIAFAVNADGSVFPGTADADGGIRCREIYDSQNGRLIPPTGFGQVERDLVRQALDYLKAGRAADIDCAYLLLHKIIDDWAKRREHDEAPTPAADR